MALQEFVTPLHKRGTRDYLERVNSHDKAHCAEVAKLYGFDYWDGERQYGFGGYRYDGRWEIVARQMIEHYGLTSESSILDIGCGKGFLLSEFKKLLPGCKTVGFDISEYAIANAKDEVNADIVLGHAKNLPFEDKSFDLIISNTTFHNLKIFDLVSAIKEVARVGRGKSWICVESYRNEKEKVNLLYWQLTCESFYSPEEWVWLYETNGLKGDFEFIYFE
jgi:protein-L-isoaspartate(D-aspartate) O-methyltransferase